MLDFHECLKVAIKDNLNAFEFIDLLEKNYMLDTAFNISKAWLLEWFTRVGAKSTKLVDELYSEECIKVVFDKLYLYKDLETLTRGSEEFVDGLISLMKKGELSFQDILDKFLKNRQNQFGDRTDGFELLLNFQPFFEKLLDTSILTSENLQKICELAKEHKEYLSRNLYLTQFLVQNQLMSYTELFESLELDGFDVLQQSQFFEEAVEKKYLTSDDFQVMMKSFKDSKFSSRFNLPEEAGLALSNMPNRSQQTLSFLTEYLVENKICSFQDIVDVSKNLFGTTLGMVYFDESTVSFSEDPSEKDYSVSNNIQDTFRKLIERSLITYDDAQYILEQATTADLYKIFQNSGHGEFEVGARAFKDYFWRSSSFVLYALENFVLTPKIVEALEGTLDLPDAENRNFFEWLNFQLTHVAYDEVNEHLAGPAEFTNFLNFEIPEGIQTNFSDIPKLQHFSFLNEVFCKFDLNKEQKLELTEVLRDNEQAQNILKQLVDNNLEDRYDFKTLKNLLTKDNEKKKIKMNF